MPSEPPCGRLQRRNTMPIPLPSPTNSTPVAEPDAECLGAGAVTPS
jgi:hypothetical protein